MNKQTLFPYIKHTPPKTPIYYYTVRTHEHLYLLPLEKVKYRHRIFRRCRLSSENPVLRRYFPKHKRHFTYFEVFDESFAGRKPAPWQVEGKLCNFHRGDGRSWHVFTHSRVLLQFWMNFHWSIWKSGKQKQQKRERTEREMDVNKWTFDCDEHKINTPRKARPREFSVRALC